MAELPKLDDESEGALIKLIEVLDDPSKVGPAAATLFVTMVGGPVAGAAAGTAAKVFGAWLSKHDNTKRLLEAVARVEDEEAQQQARGRLAALVATAVQQAQAVNYQVTEDLFGQVLLGLAGVRSDISQVLGVAQDTRAVAQDTNEAVHQLLQRSVPSPAAAGGGLYGALPERTTTFVGREAQLADLQEALTRSTHTRLAAAVEGLAGVGKTALALQLVHQLHAKKLFPGGIFWLNAEDPELTASWGTIIADGYGGIGDGSPQERATELLRRLGQAGELLVVLDNVAGWSGSTTPPSPAQR